MVAVATTCPHGLPADQCLICPTLPAGSVASATAAATTAAVPRRQRGGLHVAGVVGALVVVGLVMWALAGVVFAILHVLELAAAAVVAGWAGYRLGHYRGRRDAAR
jgi:hypothetical protein